MRDSKCAWVWYCCGETVIQKRSCTLQQSLMLLELTSMSLLSYTCASSQLKTARALSKNNPRALAAQPKLKMMFESSRGEQVPCWQLPTRSCVLSPPQRWLPSGPEDEILSCVLSCSDLSPPPLCHLSAQKRSASGQTRRRSSICRSCTEENISQIHGAPIANVRGKSGIYIHLTIYQLYLYQPYFDLYLILNQVFYYYLYH